MNEKIKMRILHLIDLGARYEDSSELKEIIDQHSKARKLYENLLKSEENLTNFYGSILIGRLVKDLIKLLRKV